MEPVTHVGPAAALPAEHIARREKLLRRVQAEAQLAKLAQRSVADATLAGPSVLFIGVVSHAIVLALLYLALA